MVNVALKDSQQRIIRSYRLADENIHDLVFLNETGRLDLVKSAAALKAEGIDFQLIEKISVKGLKSKAHMINSQLSLAFIHPEDRTAVTPDLADEDEERQFLASLKASGIGHVAAVTFILLSGWMIRKFFTPEAAVEPVQVVILPQQELPKPKAQPQVKTVKMAEKIVPKKAAKVVEHKVTPRPKIQVLVKNTRPAKTQGLKRSNQPELGTLKTLEKIGGIGTSTAGRNKGTGFGTNSAGAFGNRNGMGGGLGSGTTGGIKNALGGKGLVGGLSGEGSQAFGAQGYGSQNFGGGRAGRGGGSVGDKLGSLMVPAFNDSEVNGGLTRAQVEAVVRRNSGQLLYCYEKALQASPNLRGRMTLDWVVGPQGQVRSVSVASSSLRTKSVENCVVASVKKWKFPRPVGGVNVDISYPFDFGRMNLMAKEG